MGREDGGKRSEQRGPVYPAQGASLQVGCQQLLASFCPMPPSPGVCGTRQRLLEVSAADERYGQAGRVRVP